MVYNIDPTHLAFAYKTHKIEKRKNSRIIEDIFACIVFSTRKLRGYLTLPDFSFLFP